MNKNNLIKLSEVQRMWAEDYSITECFDVIRNDYTLEEQKFLKVEIDKAFCQLDTELRKMFLRIKYGE